MNGLTFEEIYTTLQTLRGQLARYEAVLGSYAGAVWEEADELDVLLHRHVAEGDQLIAGNTRLLVEGNTEVLLRPLTPQEILERVGDDHNTISGTVRVPLHRLSGCYELEKLMAAQLVGPAARDLRRVRWAVVGNNDRHSILVHVTGDASAIIEAITCGECGAAVDRLVVTACGLFCKSCWSWAGEDCPAELDVCRHCVRKSTAIEEIVENRWRTTRGIAGGMYR